MITTHTPYNYIYRQIVLHDPGGEKRNKGNLVFLPENSIIQVNILHIKNYLKKYF